MNHLTRSLLEGLLEEDKKVVALYGGGFKPPIGGHFEVVDEALKQYPEIDELIILVGGGERNGISQAEAILIWEIYQDYLPPKVKIQPSKMPIGDIYSFAKNNPQDIIYWIIGRREGAEDDDKDIIDRAKALKKNPEKYNNLDLKIITTQDEGMRGRNSREAAKKGKLYFTPFLPQKLSKEDKSKVFDIVSPVLKENATYSQNIDYKQMIQDLTDYMIKKGRNIEPLPKVEFIEGDSENAKDFFGKTAYYDPNTQTIVLYTEGRHPKDIVRSFSHEMVHHTQFLEDRLGDVQTTNTTEDDNLDKIEQEANLVGTMTFRNWTDSLNEIQTPAKEEDVNPKELKIGIEVEMEHTDSQAKAKVIALQHLAEDPKYYTKLKSLGLEEKKNKDPFGLNAYALELARGLEEDLEKKEYTIYSDMDGVLVDFNERFKRFSKGIPPTEYEQKFGKDKFWELVDGIGVRFWVGMDWMSDGKQLWNYIKEYNPTLLSSPSRSNYSRIGKRIWRKRNLPSTKLVLARAANKQNYADPNSILIDDRESNIDQWIKAGGIGILHTDTVSTINKLKELGL